MKEETSPILVLVVDDEVLISAVVEDALKEGGFLVVEASTWKDAKTVLDERHGEFRAVVTDINLGPRSKTGWEIARHARGLNPDMPVVYMTAGNTQEWTANGVPNSILVTKPFASAQILAAVTQLLNTTG